VLETFGANDDSPRRPLLTALLAATVRSRCRGHRAGRRGTLADRPSGTVPSAETRSFGPFSTRSRAIPRPCAGTRCPVNRCATTGQRSQTRETGRLLETKRPRVAGQEASSFRLVDPPPGLAGWLLFVPVPDTRGQSLRPSGCVWGRPANRWSSPCWPSRWSTEVDGMTPDRTMGVACSMGVTECRGIRWRTRQHH
jgi:hypothetical protein